MGAVLLLQIIINILTSKKKLYTGIQILLWIRVYKNPEFMLISHLKELFRKNVLEKKIIPKSCFSTKL
jgi:hypothetical protein